MRVQFKSFRFYQSLVSVNLRKNSRNEVIGGFHERKSSLAGARREISSGNSVAKNEQPPGYLHGKQYNGKII